MPLRTQPTPVIDTEVKVEQVKLGIAERIEERRRRASTNSQLAIAADEEFMEMVREKTKKNTKPRRGIEHSQKYWDSHVRLARQQARALKDAPEGSIEWQYRQNLLDSVDDGPQ